MTSNRFTARRRAAATAVLVLGAVLALAACGGRDTSTTGHSDHGADSPAAPSAYASAAAAAHNGADVSFAQAMIPHHRQAVEMADLAAGRASAAGVRTLASEIKRAQDPEIRTLSEWLTAWGEDVPAQDASAADGAGHSGHSGHSMSGMMSGDAMAELSRASGKAFDTAFLRMMVEHHEGAVEMARSERSRGAHQGARRMAGAIVTSQTAEITRMNTLLGRP
ncbi:DUF305 domain-containing protein [Streptomyces sp. NPDC127033]|uniref:DUF305 domain-containing protein n=1 Tax=Streptomyces sp. NPDC127033 TaxID=3347110 RepID=UPI0036505A06